MKTLSYYLAQIQVDPNDVPLPKSDLSSTSLQSAWRIALGLAGAIAVLIIVLAAFKYVVSVGDPQTANKAKNAIIYAIIGLIVALTAFGIISFALNRI